MLNEEMQKDLCNVTPLTEVYKHSEQYNADACILMRQTYKNMDETKRHLDF